MKTKLMAELRAALPNAVVLRHEDNFTSGIPDFTVDWRKFTSWWEVKHATPSAVSRDVQDLTCRRLARASYCRYVIYFENGVEKKTLIVHPDHFHTLTAQTKTEGFNHQFIVDFITRVHTWRGEN